MDITGDDLRKSVAAEAFGDFEPFVTGDERAVTGFYCAVLGSIERSGLISVALELEHHGSGYASYLSAFLHPRDGTSRVEHPGYIETTGVLLYLSRLAPLAVFGRSSRTVNKASAGGSSGFIDSSNLNLLPDGDWSGFDRCIRRSLEAAQIELLPREPLLQPAPRELAIPTAFDPPYFVFDALFYWSD